MRIKTGLNWRMLLSGLAIMCLTTTTAWALTITLDFHFPGVDSGGNLSSALGAPGQIKANVNTRTGRFTAKGSARVQNLSGAKQTYLNVPVNIPDVTVNQSKYTVKKNGNATAVASGTASS